MVRTPPANILHLTVEEFLAFANLAAAPRQRTLSQSVRDLCDVVSAYFVPKAVDFYCLGLLANLRGSTTSEGTMSCARTLGALNALCAHLDPLATPDKISREGYTAYRTLCVRIRVMLEDGGGGDAKRS